MDTFVTSSTDAFKVKVKVLRFVLDGQKAGQAVSYQQHLLAALQPNCKKKNARAQRSFSRERTAIERPTQRCHSDAHATKNITQNKKQRKSNTQNTTKRNKKQIIKAKQKQIPNEPNQTPQTQKKNSQVAPYRQNVQMKSGLAMNSAGFVTSTLIPCFTEACIPIVPLAL